MNNATIKTGVDANRLTSDAVLTDVYLTQGDGGARKVKTTTIPTANVVTASAVLADGSMAIGNGARGVKGYTPYRYQTPLDYSTLNITDATLLATTDRFDGTSSVSWEWLNQKSAAVATNALGATFTVPFTSTGTDKYHAYVQALPAGDLTYIMKVRWNNIYGTASIPWIGIALPTGTKDQNTIFLYDQHSYIDNDYTAFRGVGVVNDLDASPNPTFTIKSEYSACISQIVYYKVSRATTTWTFSISDDGLNWNDLYTASEATIGVTPTKIGIGLYAGAASAGTIANLLINVDYFARIA